MNEEQQRVIDELRHAGFAVVVFYPEEVGEANPRHVEDWLCELGNEVIEATA